MLTWLNPEDEKQAFPALDTATDEPNGLLAAGGCLSPNRLINAYRNGIFPWFSDDQPILWWSPDPRLVLRPSDIHISKSLKKFIRKDLYQCTIDKAFNQVIKACSGPRLNEDGTWITNSMKQAYQDLHDLGVAHSIEVWQDDKLIGGLYGIAIGQVFFGESMFSHKANASKVAFAHLCEKLDQWGYQYIDCQVESEHLISLGAYEVDREFFKTILDKYCDNSPSQYAWSDLN